jgi:uncharacterized protein (UPF0335 family)
MSTERDNLEIHVDLCELRYKQLDQRMDRVEQRIDDITADIKEVKTEMATGFAEIKTMLTQARDEKFKTVVMTAGSIIVGLLGLLGYIVVHLK